MPRAAPAKSFDGTAKMGQHSTQVFAGSFPHEETAALARLALDAGEAVVFILQPHRLSAMRDLLAGLEPAYYIDTDAALEAMTSGRRLEKTAIDNALQPIIKDARQAANGRVALFTDAAGTLLLQGRPDDSRLLEGLCHGMCSADPTFLVCFYPLEALARLQGHSQDFRHEHGLASEVVAKKPENVARPRHARASGSARISVK